MSIKKRVLIAYLACRLILLRCLAGAARRWIRHPTGGANILIVRPDRLGDLVLTIPVIENIKQGLPKSRIAVLVSPALAGLARLVPSVDEVIPYTGLWSAVPALRRGGFDVAVDMLADYRIEGSLACLFSGAPKRIGFRGFFKDCLFTDTVAPGPARRSIADIDLEVLGPLGIPVAVRQPRLIINGVVKMSPPVVIVHPGGHYPSQRWPAERFAALAGRIAERYEVRIAVAGGPADRDAVDTIIARLPRERVTTICGDIEGLARALAAAALLVCNNSGPLHLAAALGTPTVSTMGPTDPDLWWPQGKEQVVVRADLSCAGCGRGACGDHRCMAGISVDDMFRAVSTILDRIDGINKH